VTTPPFHAGEVGVDYTPVDLAATGGVQPYTWTTSAGVLPDGLTLTSAGHVSGTPTRGGGFSFTVQVSDAGGAAASLAGTIGIAAAPSASLIPACARACSVEVGCVDVCGTFGTLTGGTAPFTYAVNPGGYIPVGTHVNGLSLAGTFTQRAQYWQFTVVVTDALGQTTSLTPTFYVFPHITLASGSCTTTFYAFGCKTSLSYSVGTPAGTPQVTGITATGNFCPPPNYVCQASTAPPPGFAASVSGGVVLVSVAPANRPGFAYTGTVTIRLSDQSLCSSGTNCSTTATVAVSVGLG
jgi:hypothetical protein